MLKRQINVYLFIIRIMFSKVLFNNDPAGAIANLIWFMHGGEPRPLVSIIVSPQR